MGQLLRVITVNIIRSRFHNVFTKTVNKVVLSANDDKRVVMEDKISTLAIGHVRAEKKYMKDEI